MSVPSSVHARCNAEAFMHGRLVVCDLPKGHVDRHAAFWPHGVTWEWGDNELRTTYPPEPGQ